MKALKLWEFQNFFNENKFSIIRYNTSDQEYDGVTSLIKLRLAFNTVKVFDGIDGLFLVDNQNDNQMSILSVVSVRVSDIIGDHFCDIEVDYDTYDKKNGIKTVYLCAQ